jgi:protein-L-isoaspartate(D-aspartate) O-methyltransferase
MVEQQLRRRGIRDERVLAAFMDVPRERFLPSERVEEAYADYPVPIGQGQTISQPYVVALMVENLAPQPHHRVLDVGAGSGYQTAILAKLVAHVYAVERLAGLAERAAGTLAELGIANVSFHVQDGTLGLPQHAPFDGIICGAGGPDIPPSWIAQLAEGGRIVAPIGGERSQTLVLIENRAGQLYRRDLCDVRFVPLIGEQGWQDR